MFAFSKSITVSRSPQTSHESAKLPRPEGRCCILIRCLWWTMQADHDASGKQEEDTVVAKDGEDGSGDGAVAKTAHQFGDLAKREWTGLLSLRPSTKSVRFDVPYLRQSTGLDCGPTALRMAAMHLLGGTAADPGRDAAYEAVGIDHTKAVSTIKLAVAVRKLGYARCAFACTHGGWRVLCFHLLVMCGDYVCATAGLTALSSQPQSSSTTRTWTCRTTRTSGMWVPSPKLDSSRMLKRPEL